MLSVYQHWDRLKVCAVGSVYPPDFYSFIQNKEVRSIMEKISLETEEDFQNLIDFLQHNQVQVIRTQVKPDALLDGQLLPPSLSPRDHFAMIGNTFYSPNPSRSRKWNLIKRKIYPDIPPTSKFEFDNLHKVIKLDLLKNHNIDNLFGCYSFDYSSLENIVNFVKAAGNQIIFDKNIDSAMTCRVGKDLYFGTWPKQDKNKLLTDMRNEFPDYRCHVINTDGHLDGVFAPIKEGLILCRKDYVHQIDFKTLFPGWRVVSVPQKNLQKSHLFQYIKRKNLGKWWVPGQEYNNEFTNFVNSYMNFCVGDIEETNIGVNVLMLDEHNLICSEEDSDVFKILETFGITPHIIPIRHHQFWDNGIHCLTCDLSRDGNIVDYFPERKF